MSELSEMQRQFLHLLCIRPLVGPDPEVYQGDYVHIDRPSLTDLLKRKMVGRRKLADPRDWNGNAPYLRVTHRYQILKAGKAAIGRLTQ
jgi:hypothetical protein